MNNNNGHNNKYLRSWEQRVVIFKVYVKQIVIINHSSGRGINHNAQKLGEKKKKKKKKIRISLKRKKGEKERVIAYLEFLKIKTLCILVKLILL